MKKVLFVVSYILATFFILEVGTYGLMKIRPYYDVAMWRYWTKLKRRAADPGMSHEHIPGKSADLYGAHISINSKGLRDREIDYPRTAGVRRILFLGDSLTLGWGVPFESIFSKLLEKDLTGIDGVQTEVINTGVGNYNSEQEYTYYKNEGVKYNSDMVMLLYFINDAEPTPNYKDSVLMEKSIFVVFMWSQLNKIWARFSKKKGFLNYYSDLYKDGSESWENSKNSILKIRDLAKTQKSPFIVAVCPELRIFKETYPFADVHQKILGFLKKSNIDTINLLPTFKREAEREELVWVSREDSHPNALGNRIIANGIRNFFKANPNKLTSIIQRN